jgi:hypothetical protein
MSCAHGDVVTEFFMGRFSNKVIQLAKGQAVWVVS